MTSRLVEWDSLELRLSGQRIETIAREAMGRGDAALEELRLDFLPGMLRVSGRVRKAIPIPFRFVVRRVDAAGGAVTVPLEEMWAFGFVPVPTLLTRLVGDRRAGSGISFEAGTSSVVIQLDRFLPSFVEVEVEEIRIIDGGLAVRLGRGGADLPEFPGGESWSAVQRSPK